MESNKLSVKNIMLFNVIIFFMIDTFRAYDIDGDNKISKK